MPIRRTSGTRSRSAGLDQPDSVDYEPGSLVFRWSGPKVAVIVDLEPHPEDDRLIA